MVALTVFVRSRIRICPSRVDKEPQTALQFAAGKVVLRGVGTERIWELTLSRDGVCE